MRDGFFVYDAHTHIGAARHSGRHYSAADLLRDMDRFGVDKSLAMPFPVVDDYRATHDLIASAIRTAPDRLAGAACLNPFIPEDEFRDEVRRCRETHGFVALKLQPQYQAVNPLWSRNRYVFESALESGLVLVWHTGAGIPYSLPSLLMPAARDYPDLKIVLAHCGGGLLAGEAIVAASFCPNILLELSSLMPNQVHEIASSIACDRLMIGSDLPENLGVEMSKILEMNLSDQQKRAILGGTAHQVFG